MLELFLRLLPGYTGDRSEGLAGGLGVGIPILMVRDRLGPWVVREGPV
jgi:hypothetical protein